MSEVGERVREGRLVGGRYRLLERIGSGGAGTVWRAADELTDREVALKRPRLPGVPGDEVYRRAAHRLYREARAAARVEHPSAVLVHDVVVEGEGEDGLPWTVMELVRGESLHELLGRERLEPAEAARIGLAVLGALRAAHAVGIVHRDVKPANVLLGPDRRVVVTDFGTAQLQGAQTRTVEGEFEGALDFVAPERVSGTGAGPASDLWSLGALLHAAVEGASPFRRTTAAATLDAILADDPPEPGRAGPLGPLLLRLLARNPEERPAAEEAAAVLTAVATGGPVPDLPDASKRAEGPDTRDDSESRPGPDLSTHLDADPGPDPDASLDADPGENLRAEAPGAAPAQSGPVDLTDPAAPDAVPSGPAGRQPSPASGPVGRRLRDLFLGLLGLLGILGLVGLLGLLVRTGPVVGTVVASRPTTR
ncbi:serine/threonine-protein kinase [Streptomyces sp. NPDC005423]|uniref:serine/threonine-protein kinase n=1 Tax=Streptomyces sp. NPDC005423 TaxID=3155343 RepID=UPI0033BAF59E